MSYGSRGQLRPASAVRRTDTVSWLASRLWQQPAIVFELAVRQRYHASWNPIGGPRYTSRSERLDVA